MKLLNATHITMLCMNFYIFYVHENPSTMVMLIGIFSFFAMIAVTVLHINIIINCKNKLAGKL